MQKTNQRKPLEKYGQQGHMGGWINSFIQGRTLEAAYKDGTWLILRFTDGHEARIGWQDVQGNQLRGEPFMENMDVRIVLSGASMGASAQKLGS